MPRAYGLAVWRLFLFCIVTLTLSPFHWLFAKINPPLGSWWGRRYLDAWRWCVGHTIIVRGEKIKENPTLFVANHSSYMDILVLGPLLNARFVAKKEVAQWPLIGWLATNQGTLYIDRSRTAIAEGTSKLRTYLEAGESLILFPEGTTTDGCRVLPFGSSFFDIALATNTTVQPVTITYAGWDNLPMPRFMRKRCGWFSLDLGVGPHLWNIIQWGTIQVIIEFHPPLNPKDYTSRKELAQATHQAVQQGLVNAFRHPLSKAIA